MSLLLARIEQEEQPRFVSVTGAISAIWQGVVEYRFAFSRLKSFSVVDLDEPLGTCAHPHYR